MVEFALENINQSIGVSTYRVTRELLAPMSRYIQMPENALSGSRYCTRFPEFAELFVLKPRTESDARKKDSVIFVLISRTNFSRNFVRVLCATVREFSAVKMQSNPGKGLKTNKRDSGNLTPCRGRGTAKTVVSRYTNLPS
jgi:hypothetical protein